ncbi:hypothetical protein [Halorussus salinisoli]|uniref:hypothetical protein n=1 Tax=Halorussus salinisoli TaxID=2558242 RepID=UPI0010C1CB5B|nr:hypothetical protein [Halorussus salinisoli]
MSDNSSVGASASRSAVRRLAPATIEGPLSDLLGLFSVTRLGGVAVAGVVAYFLFVIPDELAVVLTAAMVGAVLTGLLPLAIVFAVVRSPV